MLAKLRNFFKDNNSAALIMSEENICYFTSFHSSNGYLVVTKDKSYFLTDSRYIEAAQNKIAACEEILLIKNMKEDISSLLKKIGVNVLYLEAERTTVSRYNDIVKAMDFCEVVCDGKLDIAIDEIRKVKTQHQVDSIIKAQRISEKAFEHIIKFISTEKTEKEIALELEYFMLRNGADALSFETIAVSGKNSS
ncbi:MAG: aminopeptidase P family N-terminal domain-containing protein, partial [Acutalibacteraceae bacterium]|nr:aminopeptidase P family N-terminal domain-containing protein [Acutalibacteraceae bacterium]